MKREITTKDIWIGILFVGIFTVGTVIANIFLTPKPQEIVYNNYEPDLTEIKSVKMPSGWECDVPEQTMDLLQPSGYYIMDTVDCWKLEMTVQQFCAEFYPNTNCGKE